MFFPSSEDWPLDAGAGELGLPDGRDRPDGLADPGGDPSRLPERPGVRRGIPRERVESGSAPGRAVEWQFCHTKESVIESTQRHAGLRSSSPSSPSCRAAFKLILGPIRLYLGHVRSTQEQARTHTTEP